MADCFEFKFLTKKNKTKGEHMNINETVFVVLGIGAFVIASAVIAQFRHIFVAISLYDLRKTTIQVAGQEVLTADNVSVKFSLMVTYQFADVAKAAHETQSWYADLYNAAQLALRSVISGLAAEALLNQRNVIDAQLLPIVQESAAKVGVSVLAVEVKDVILPADLKRAFAETLKAKQEGQAALERARGETAALRNLATAARVLEGNPALMNLR